MPARGGVPVVLSADQTLMAHHRLLLDGMLAASQTTSTPIALLRRLLLPAAPHPHGRALVAPLGLRRVQAALLGGGFDEAEVAAVDEAHLAAAIGPDTRLVAISSGEPLGLGMNSSTMAAVSGGRIWPQALFERLLSRVRRLIGENGSPARVLVGGAGAWQLLANEPHRRALGIDHALAGYCEANVAAVCRRLVAGENLPPVIQGEPPTAAAIPPITAPATMGATELSRGCGLGCGFCTIGAVGMCHLPPETILADIATNLTSGNPNVCLLSEDFLRYGGRGARCEPAALLGLLRRARELTSGLLQVDHVNAASVGQYDDDQLREMHDLLAGDEKGLVWVNIGIESASGALLERSGGRPKMAGVAAGDWGDYTAAQLRRLCATGYLPLASLVLGLPGETTDDLTRTLTWVRSLADLRLTIYPMLLAPVDGSPPPEPLTRLHWQLVRECYALNFRHMPGIYWDNQGRGGTSPAKRLLFQAAGRGQVLQWGGLLRWRQLRARP